MTRFLLAKLLDEGLACEQLFLSQQHGLQSVEKFRSGAERRKSYSANSAFGLS